MSTQQMLLDAIVADPLDDSAWLALADCLEEQDQLDRAELVRLRHWLGTGAQGWERQHREERLRHLLAAGTQPAGPRLTIALDQQVSLDLVLIPPGTFLMGSPDGEKERSA